MIIEEAKELGRTRLVYIKYNRTYLWYEDVTDEGKIYGK